MMSIFCALYTQVLLDVVARIGTLVLWKWDIMGLGSQHTTGRRYRGPTPQRPQHIYVKGSLCLECPEGLGSVPEAQWITGTDQLGRRDDVTDMTENDGTMWRTRLRTTGRCDGHDWERRDDVTDTDVGMVATLLLYIDSIASCWTKRGLQRS